MLPALGLLIAAAVARAVYPNALERRQGTRRTLGGDGVVVGAQTIDLPIDGAHGVLLMHGAGDTPQSHAELARHLHEHGFSVRAPLLSGHGRALAALRSVSAEDWWSQTRAEFDRMRARHDRVSIVGLSMGGALAATLAAERDDVASLVLLAPYLEMPQVIGRLASTAALWGWLVPYFSSQGAASIHDPAAAERALGHGVLTPAALRALRDVVEKAERALPRVKAPALVIQSREDNRIAPESAERGFARLGSTEKRFVWTSGAGHVITVDYGYQRVFDLTANWLERHREPAGAGQRERRPRIKL